MVNIFRRYPSSLLWAGLLIYVLFSGRVFAYTIFNGCADSDAAKTLYCYGAPYVSSGYSWTCNGASCIQYYSGVQQATFTIDGGSIGYSMSFNTSGVYRDSILYLSPAGQLVNQGGGASGDVVTQSQFSELKSRVLSLESGPANNMWAMPETTQLSNVFTFFFSLPICLYVLSYLLGVALGAIHKD